jgi:uncharacterized protein DUF2304
MPPEPLHLTPLQQAGAILGSITLLAFVGLQIYRGKLREDYGALWFTAAGATVLLAVWQDGLRLVAQALDALTLTAPIFLLSIVFLTVVAIHYSVRFSELSAQVHELARELALLRSERDEGVIKAPPA